MKKIAIATACGAKKEKFPQPAWRLYKSSRIRHLYKKSRELGYPFYILSARYGLVPAERVLEPYDEILTPSKIQELIPIVSKTLKKFDVVVYYKGGARREYLELMSIASRIANTRLVTFGYANMGDIGKLESIIELVKKNYL
ncbi:hypothetical protein X802_02825 [Thermococcus guaymasensis DSM 11113]|uniref:DUF6884 domain-containing protein n=2 Tax=Thermococcus guaymasensis TaxID=110164 RepID=A0A0X1KIX8_9EURY|nr:hypothetical protein X802_02825 [Thermococcus guaymasensis DSM 11113]